MPRRQKLLIVDDRPENLHVLEVILAGCAADVIRAQSGNDALTACLNHEFALAILDVQMPEMDGFELAGLLRCDERTRDLPIIFLTAELADSPHMFKGYESGAVDYLVKPFSAPILLSKVKVFLELHRRKLELLDYQRKLEETNAELEAFAHSVSHDLRAPLRAIEAYSRALLEDEADHLGDLGKEYVTRSVAAAQRMEQLIEALLRLSRVSHAEMLPETVCLGGLATEILDELRRAEPERQVEVSIARELVAVGDPALLRQLLQNLLGNAWKFSARRPDARIEFGSECLDGETVFFVRDNGAGFDMKYAQTLFAPFRRLHTAAEFEGTGVGLATVRRIVDRHGGRIWATSEVGRGATFRFTLASGPLRLPGE